MTNADEGNSDVREIDHTSGMESDFLFPYPTSVIEHIQNSICSGDCTCYRITKNNPALESDFVPQRFMNNSRRLPPGVNFYGISVLTSVEGAKRLLLRYPGIGSFIHSGHIDPPTHGFLINCRERENHKDWYPKKNIQPEQVVCRHEYTCP